MSRENYVEIGNLELKKDLMESVIAHLELAKDGMWCGLDTANALMAIRRCGLSKSDQSKLIKGPLTYYNYLHKGFITARHHIIGVVDKSWIIDMAQAPCHRIFFDWDDYLARSGIDLSLSK